MSNHLLNMAIIATTVAIPFVGTEANAAAIQDQVRRIDSLEKKQFVEAFETGHNVSSTETDNVPPDLNLPPVSFTRTLELTNVGTPNIPPIDENTAPSAKLGIPIGSMPGLSFSNDATVTSYAYINYNFGTTPIDLTAGGADNFSIGIATADHPGAIDLMIDGELKSQTFDTQDNQELHWAFENFSDSLDLTSVTEIAFVINTNDMGMPPMQQEDADVTINFIGTTNKSTPEPGTVLGLTFAGVAGLVTRRRRQK